MSNSLGNARVLALVFTDLAGSTALKQQHGDDAGRALIARHRALVRKCALEQAGRIIDWAGDGCFLTFDTSSTAVQFALKLQTGHAADPALPPVRVGIHMGEVTETPVSATDFEDTSDRAGVRVEGISVDVAARICSLARPSQVLMSSAVRSSAQSRIAADAFAHPIVWRDYGGYLVKGFDQPLDVSEAGIEGVSPLKPPLPGEKVRKVRRAGPASVMVGASFALAAIVAVSMYPLTQRLEAPVLDSADEPIRRVAVLPFDNRTGDPEDEVLALGLGEELCGELGKVGSLVVVSHSAARDAVQRNGSGPGAARELRADGFIEGSLVRDGELVRVRVALVRARTAEEIWSDSFVLAGGDMLSLQSRWALEAATAMKAKITPEERGRLQRTRPTDPDAERAYMTGMRQWSLRTRDGFVRALAEYTRAVQIDHTYADAYGALAAAWAAMADYAVQEPISACERAFDFAETALEIDETVVEARLAQGICTFLVQRDYPATVKMWDDVVRIEPSNADVVYWRGVNLFRLGRFDEAIDVNRQAMRLNPMSSQYCSAYAAMLLGAHRNAEALEFSTDAMETFAGDLSVLGMHVAALLRNGRIEDAAAVLESRRDDVQPYAFWLMRYGAYHAMAGQPEIARAAMSRLRDQPGYHDAAAFAAIHAALGEVDEAFSFAERAVESHSALIGSIVWDPAWDNLRHDARYIDILRKLGLTDFADAEQARIQGSLAQSVE